MVQAVEMSYLRGACGLNRMDGESVYGKFGMSFKSERINCGAVEVINCKTLIWFGHLERMEGDELTKRICKSGVDAVCERKTPYKMEGQSVGILEGKGG